MIKVKLLDAAARLPSVNYSGQDLGFDLYAIEDVTLPPGIPVKVRTGIAVEGPAGMGFVLGDRSSLAARGVTYAGGRIDAGYRGEILVCLINVNQPAYSLALQHGAAGAITDAQLTATDVSVHLKSGDKIAQMSPFQAMTHLELVVVDELSSSLREAKGFGSSGR
jgi:dUTP pyrophosphatase